MFNQTLSFIQFITNAQLHGGVMAFEGVTVKLRTCGLLCSGQW